MSVKVYDTLSAKKQIFEPRHPPLVKIYGCGPTVYGYTHVGNARAFLTQDLVVRVLSHAGYQVQYARNYTDIDDKIIQRARDEGKTSEEVADFYTRAFDLNMIELDILKPTFTPRATTSISSILEMISALEKAGLAYATGGDVYFRVKNFSHYGCLSRRKLDDMLSGTRIDSSEQKESAADFALWKGAKPGEPAWPSPWGSGRPGWHIECSAMIHEIFNDEIDIHMGGLDLIFPHHENEIAQSEGLTGRTFAKYWVHNGMLEVGQEKMSKSLGNLMTISDFVSDYGGECLRLLFAQNHYRSPLEFSSETILRAEALVDRLYSCKALALEAGDIKNRGELPTELAGLPARVEEALYDDFNSAKALGFVFSGARVCFREKRSEFWAAWAEVLPLLDKVFGLAKKNPELALGENKDRRLKRMNLTVEDSERIDSELLEREQLRLQKKFAEADLVRKKLEAEGIVVMDGPDGTSWVVK